MNHAADNLAVSDRDSGGRDSNRNALYKLICLALIAGGVVYLFRNLYYFIFPWVLSKNIIYPPGTLTPWIEGWNAERDGIEIYVLYAFMLLIVATVVALAATSKFVRNRWVVGVLLACALTYSYRLVSSVVFTPPSKLISPPDVMLFVRCALFGALLLILLYGQKKISNRVEAVLVFCLLLPFCFIATEPIAMSNYVYIFSPAQKLLEGVGLRQIYFQYDLFLSLIAALWMKLNFSLTLFQLLGQISYFATIFGIFLLSRSLFRQKSLSLLLLIALIVVRILSAPWDPVYVFQITPLRLDLWLVPLAIIYFRGPFHWLLPLSCGVLMLIHGNFGLIYALGYVQLIGTLSVLSMMDAGIKTKLAQWATPQNILRLLTVAIFLGGCFLISRIVFSSNLEATSYYQKIGIGFIPLKSASLFWIVPAIISSAFVLLCALRNLATPKYTALGFALIYFVLGSCIYFFGRSDELNLFSIAIPLLFVLFFTLDLFDRWLFQGSVSQAPVFKGNLALILGLCFILTAAYKCSDQIRKNVSLMLENAFTLQLHPGDPFVEAQAKADAILDEIHGVIGESSVVQFAGLDDNLEFSLYQRIHGNSAYFYPFSSWIFLDALVHHEQNLLNDGAYLLIDKVLFQNLLEARLRGVGFKYTTQNGQYVLIAKSSPLLPGRGP